LFGNKIIDLTTKTGAVAQHIRDLGPCVKDGRAPSGRRFYRRRGFEFEEVPENPPDL
jgi:hypothetical protein